MADPSPQLYLPKIVHARIQTGGSIGSYVDREYCLDYCEKGEVDFRLETKLYRMGPGTALLLPPHLPHALSAIRDANQKYLLVHFRLPPEATLLRSFPMIVQFKGADAALMARRMHVLLDEWSARKPGYDLVATGILIEVLGHFWRNAGAGVIPVQSASKAWRNIERVIPWIHRNASEPLTIETMSERAGLSPAYFCRAFKEYTGRSPHNYVNGVRVENARQLLTDAELNCTEVATRVGFPSVAAFSKTFRRFVGLSPSRWVDATLTPPR
jgi:AraC-like DNA-binding protein